MKNTAWIYFFLFGSVLFFSCNKKNKVVVAPSPSYDVEEGTISNEKNTLKKQQTAKVAPAPHVIASIQKNGCFGNCPEYEFVLLSNGKAAFNGKKFFSKLGNFEGQATAGLIMELKDKIKEFEYFKFEKMYPTNGQIIKDLPDTYTLINLNKQQRIIRNNHDAPKRLLDFEKYLESLIDRIVWEKVGQQ